MNKTITRAISIVLVLLVIGFAYLNFREGLDGGNLVSKVVDKNDGSEIKNDNSSINNIGPDQRSDAFHKNLTINGKEVNIYGSIVDPKKTKIRIVSPETLAAKTPSEQYTGLSLKEYSELGKYKAVYSGGYLSSWSPPMPLGYVKIDGEVLNRGHSTYLTKGLFCVRDGEIAVTSVDDAQLEKWDNCLQTGMPLVQNGKVIIDQRSEGWYITGQPNIQAFICEYNDGKALIGMTQEEVSLSVLAEYMAKTEDKGGLGCVNAVGRAGGRTAGMVIDQNGESQDFGNTEIPLPNALVIDQETGTHGN